MSKELEVLLNSVDGMRDEIVQFHQAIVRIPSVSAPGQQAYHETKVCEYIKDHFDRNGISSSILESGPGRGNLVAEIGESAPASILLMSHIDVVPVGDESKWGHPPFSAHLADGIIYGRGSDDAKSLTTASVFAMTILSASGLPLPRKIRMLAAADEETGGSAGAQWMAEHHPEKIRADFAVNEGARGPMETPSGRVYPIGIGEKGRTMATIRVTGKASHAAQPWLGVNPIPVAAEVIRRLEAIPIDTNVSLDYFDRVRQVYDLEAPITADNVDQVAQSVAGEHADLSSTLRALSRMTVTPTMISAGTNSNSLAPHADIVVDIRTLPDQTPKYVESAIEGALEGLAGVTVEFVHTAASNASPAENEWTSKIAAAIEMVSGESQVRLLPVLARGFTDSRHLRPIGMDVYGFAPLHDGANQSRKTHAVDEFMEVDSILYRIKLTIALAYLASHSGA